MLMDVQLQSLRLHLKFSDDMTFVILRFQVKKKEFFRNFITIMFFGVIGVFISFGIISTGESSNSLKIYLNYETGVKPSVQTFKW